MWTTDSQLAPASTGRVLPWRLGPLGDERLARLVAGGNERAFTALYHRYHQRIYRYCRSLLQNDADAQDAFQATFANAYTALARGQRDAPMRPWLYRIAHNESITLLRRRKPETALIEAHEPWTASAVEVADERARLALLVADLGELSERQRGALVMRELSGLSHEEIAVALGISVGAAKQTIFEARQSLAEFAQGRVMACEDICRAISDGNGRVMRGRRVRAHLRDCGSCAAFAVSIRGRSRDLRAIAPPLSAGAAASLLRHSIGGGSAHGGSGTSAGLATGAAGKAATVAVTAKTIAAAAAVATTAVGLTGIIRHLDRHPVNSAGAPMTAASRSGGGAGSSATTTQARHVMLARGSSSDRRSRAGGAAAGGRGSQAAGHRSMGATRNGPAGTGSARDSARPGSPAALRSDGSHGAGTAGGTGTVNGVEQGTGNGANNGHASGHGTGKAAGAANGGGKAEGAANGNGSKAKGAANGNGKAKGAASRSGKATGAANGNGEAKANGASHEQGNANGAANGAGKATGTGATTGAAGASAGGDTGGAASPIGATTTPGTDGDGVAAGAGGTTSTGNGVGNANGGGNLNDNGKGSGATNGNGANK